MCFMKVLYVSDALNHHHLPLFVELKKYFDESIFATPVIYDELRAKMGFPNVRIDDDIFEIKKDNFEKFENMFMTYDIVLCNIREYHQLMYKRLKLGKLTFYFSERWIRKKIYLLQYFFTKRFFYWMGFKKLSNYDNFFYLAQGMFAANDFKRLGLCKNRILSFGYFTSVNILSKLSCNKDVVNILWTGRMFPCKNVDLLIKAFDILSQKHKNIHLTVVGEGEKSKQVDKMIKCMVNKDLVTRYGFIPTSNVLKLMCESDIFVFPSSSYEGWGCVVNEAMSCSCAVLSSDAVGSSRSLIKNGVNGLFFKSGSLLDLIMKLTYLIENVEDRRSMQKEALHTMRHEWSPSVVAQRFYTLIELLNQGKECSFFEKGVFSNL